MKHRADALGVGCQDGAKQRETTQDVPQERDPDRQPDNPVSQQTTDEQMVDICLPVIVEKSHTEYLQNLDREAENDPVGDGPPR
ncbi:hypothetical protein ACFVXE_22635 [Streptomyces sp. NPDC058231]|uniref:hypothetical protein n=1 Tax=Streptomyces sp. NPDC058231 TaxID=3346392 RepID=UPI0036E06BCE